MYRVIACIRYEHDLRLVALAIAICALTAWTAFYLYSTSQRASGLNRTAWILLTGLASGSGIWATHFIAMLAFKSGLPITYDPGLTMASLLLAIIVTAAGFCLASIDEQRSQAVAGGVLIGIGIAAMHYMGMEAMLIPGRIHWDPTLVVMSIGAGVLLSAATMWVFHQHPNLGISAFLLTIAICALHFTAMGAAVVEYDPTVNPVAAHVDSSLLAALVATVTIMVILVGLLAAFLNRRTAHENQELVNEWQYLAYHDGLTGLPNRRAIRRSLDEIVRLSRMCNCPFALFYLDLDGFKNINDTFGHAAGDHVLQQAARRLQRTTLGRALVGRSGGDEFIVVQSGFPQPTSAELLAEQIMLAFKLPFEVPDGHLVNVGVSIGISLHPGDDRTAEGILRNADTALYQAKRNGPSSVCLAA